VATVATANTLEHDRARVLEKQLARAKDNLAKVHEKLAAEEAKVAELQKKEATATLRLRALATMFVQGESLDKYLLPLGQQARVASRRAIEQALAEQLALPVRDAEQLSAAMKAKGYNLSITGPAELTVLETKTGAKFGYADIRPNGQDFTQQMQAAVARGVVAQEPALEITERSKGLKPKR
jgi:hypothetical protein